MNQRQNPTVTVITPTYNHEQYISFAIESVIAQTFENWEMLIVDDGSTDRTAAIVSTYSDPRIKLLKQPHQGLNRLSQTYNHALHKSRGKYIAILEGDDQWPIYKLEQQVSVLENNPAVVLSYGRAGLIDSSNEPIGLYFRPTTNGELISVVDILLDHASIQPVTVVIRRAELLKAGGFQQHPLLPVVDLPTWLHLSQQGFFHYSESVWGLWRRHAEQTTGNKQFRMGMAVIVAIEYFNGLSIIKQKRLGLTVDQILKKRQIADDDYLWLFARSLCQRGRIIEARRVLKKLMLTGKLFRRFEAVIALCASYVGLDFDRMTEQASWKLNQFLFWSLSHRQGTKPLIPYPDPQLLQDALLTQGALSTNGEQSNKGSLA